ncbi:hypothetical protein AVEN_3435-1 [Araneus ventricosus]|uniref:Uncharacterized protein n=1 Tax=Araneus ventricosus TaxID=182803 RepID=A0A4Y2NI51_ARAVE|nr:hypothetical protein AVEN_3435-1 [Araneus ventricosus]
MNWELESEEDPKKRHRSSSKYEYVQPSFTSLDEQGIVGWLEPYREMSLNAWTSKVSASTDGDLSTFPTGCCRLYLWHEKDMACRILTSNKTPMTDVERRNTDYGSRNKVMLDTPTKI